MIEKTFGTIPANVWKTVSTHVWVYHSNKRVKHGNVTISIKKIPLAHCFCSHGYCYYTNRKVIYERMI